MKIECPEQYTLEVRSNSDLEAEFKLCIRSDWALDFGTFATPFKRQILCRDYYIFIEGVSDNSHLKATVYHKNRTTAECTGSKLIIVGDRTHMSSFCGSTS